MDNKKIQIDVVEKQFQQEIDIHVKKPKIALEKEALAFFKGDKGDKGDRGEAGTNISTITKTSTSGLVDTYTVTLTDGSTTTFQVTNGQTGSDGKSAYESAQEGGYSGSESDFNSGLANINNFITNAVNNLINYYTKTQVDNLIGAITTINATIVVNLPTADSTTYFNTSKTIYLVKNTAVSGSDYYYEYITVRTGTEGNYTYSWEKIGDTQIDLSGYVPTSRKVNNKALSSDITLTASDVGAEASFSKNTAFNKNFETNTSNIKMNGNASVGTSSNVARADHIHPKDTSKQDTLVSGVNIKTIGGESILGSGNINMSNGLYISEDVQWDEDTEDASFSADEFLNGHCPTRDGDLVYVTGNGALFQCVNITYDEDDELYYTELIFLNYYYFWDFVRFSDYARSNRAGVVKVSTAYGFNMLTNGSIILQQATEYQIRQKASTYAPITANNYDYAVSQSTDVVAIKSKIPSTASDTNQLVTEEDIPTVNNPTITITQGGVTKGSFTLNQSSGSTIALDAGGGGTATDVQINGTSITSSNVANILTNTAYNSSTNKIATMDDLPTITFRRF